MYYRTAGVCFVKVPLTPKPILPRRIYSSFIVFCRKKISIWINRSIFRQGTLYIVWICFDLGFYGKSFTAKSVYINFRIISSVM